MDVERHHRHDVAHHHPQVRRGAVGGWIWSCSCGGASTRAPLAANTWRQAVISALNHSLTLAA